MRAVIQRVISASVCIDGTQHAAIGNGQLILLGIHAGDDRNDAEYIVQKALNLRIFPDENGVMNRSLTESGGEILLVSQFTLYGDARKGRRPSYIEAMPPALAEPFFQEISAMFKNAWPATACGVFGADMQVSLVNDGPVTILLDSSKML
jgi:D-tyrosyl-tRNA(Tyr) deacylase